MQVGCSLYKNFQDLEKLIGWAHIGHNNNIQMERIHQGWTLKKQ